MKKESKYLLPENSRAIVKQHVGQMLLEWLDESSPHDYDPEWSDDSEVRQLKSAYAHGYNDCRMEILQQVADLVLSDFKLKADDDGMWREDDSEE